MYPFQLDLTCFAPVEHALKYVMDDADKLDIRRAHVFDIFTMIAELVEDENNKIF